MKEKQEIADKIKQSIDLLNKDIETAKQLGLTIVVNSGISGDKLSVYVNMPL